MLSLLLTLLVGILIGSLAYWIIVRVVPIGTPQNIALAVLGILAIFWLVGLLTGSVPMFSAGRLT